MNFMRKLVSTTSSSQNPSGANQSQSPSVNRNVSRPSATTTTSIKGDFNSSHTEEDDLVALQRLRTLFAELYNTHNSRDAQREPTFNADQLADILPIFCRLFLNASSSEMMEKFSDLHAFSTFIARFTVHEIKKRATQEQTEQAAVAVCNYLMPIPSVSNQKEKKDTKHIPKRIENTGWLLLQSLVILTSNAPVGVIELLCKASLPSTLVKLIYIFLELPSPEEIVADQSTHRLDVLYTSLRKLLIGLSQHSCSVEEIRQKNDFRRLFEAVASKARPSAQRWKKLAFDILLAIAKNGLNFALVEHISNQKCIPECLKIVRHIGNSSGSSNSSDLGRRLIDVADTLIVLFHYLLRSSDISSRLLDAFRQCTGYPVVNACLVNLEKECMQHSGDSDPTYYNECVEAIRHLVHLVGELTTCGALELTPKESTMNDQLYVLPGFEVAKPKGKGDSVRNTQAFHVLQTTFLRAESEILCSCILDTIQRIYHQDRANYFILEPEKTITTLAEKIYLKPPSVQEQFFELIESLVVLLKYVPMKEISSLTILMKLSSSNITLIRCINCLLRLATIDPVFREVYRDVGILELTLEQLQIYARTMKETEAAASESSQSNNKDNSESEWCQLGHLVLRLMTTMISGQPRTADVLREQGGIRCLLSLLPYARARPGVLQVFRELLRFSGSSTVTQQGSVRKGIVAGMKGGPSNISNPSASAQSSCDADLSSLVTTVVGCSIEDAAQGTLSSAPRQALAMKIDVLRCLCSVMRESHRCRTSFRKCGGYPELMRELKAMQRSLLPLMNTTSSNNVVRFIFPTCSSDVQEVLKSPLGWSQVEMDHKLNLLKTIIMLLSFSMKYEPANADYFLKQIRYAVFTDRLRQLGCFHIDICHIEKRENVVPGEQTNAIDEFDYLSCSQLYVKYFFTLYVDQSLKHLAPSLLHAIVVARCLYELAFDSFDRPPGVRSTPSMMAATSLGECANETSSNHESITAPNNVMQRYSSSSSSNVAESPMTRKGSMVQGGLAMGAMWYQGPICLAWYDSYNNVYEPRTDPPMFSVPPDPRVNLTLVHPAAISSLLHLIPSMAVIADDSLSSQSDSNLDAFKKERFQAWQQVCAAQLALLRVICTILQRQRHAQVLCQEYVLHTLLNRYGEAVNDFKHPLHYCVSHLIERLAIQHIRGKELRIFLRLGDPLCCAPIDIPLKIIHQAKDLNKFLASKKYRRLFASHRHEHGGPLTLARLQSLAAIMSTEIRSEYFGQIDKDAVKEAQTAASSHVPPPSARGSERRSVALNKYSGGGSDVQAHVTSGGSIKRHNTKPFNTKHVSPNSSGTASSTRRLIHGVLFSTMEGRPYPKDAAQSFVELDMSHEGFGCLFLPSIAPQHGRENVTSVSAMATMGFVSHPLDHNIVGGVGHGERIFPPTNGFSISTWFSIQRASHQSSSAACDSRGFPCVSTPESPSNPITLNPALVAAPHPLRLLTLVRGIPGTMEQMICLSVLLIHPSPPSLQTANMNTLEDETGNFAHSQAQHPYLLVSTLERLVSDVERAHNDGVQQDKPDGTMERHLSDSTVKIPLPQNILELGWWHHLCLVFHRATMMKHSCISVYWDGNLIASPKLNYINASGNATSATMGGPASSGGSSSNATLGMNNSIYAFVGTPPFLRKAASLLWRQGPLHIVEDTYQGGHVQLLHTLGPNYVGSYQAPPLDNFLVTAPLFSEERLMFSIFPHCFSQTNVGKIRKIYNPADGKSIAKQLQMSGKDSSTPLRLLHNTAIHLNGPARTFGAVLIGYQGVRLFTRSPLLHTLLRCVGGAVGPLLGLVAMSRSAETLLAALQILWGSSSTVIDGYVYGNGNCREWILDVLGEMEAKRGWQMLNAILKHKRSYLTVAVIKVCQRICGTLDTERDIGCLPNRPAFEALLCDLFLWMPSNFVEQDHKNEEFSRLFDRSVSMNVSNEVQNNPYLLIYEVLVHLFVLLAESQSARRVARANSDIAQAQGISSTSAFSSSLNSPTSTSTPSSTILPGNSTLIAWTKAAGLDPQCDNLVIMLECDLVAQLINLLMTSGSKRDENSDPSNIASVESDKTIWKEESGRVQDGETNTFVTWGKLVNTVSELLKLLLENVPRNEDLRKLGQFLVWTFPPLGVSEEGINLPRKPLKDIGDEDAKASEQRCILLRNMGLQLFIDLLHTYGPLNLRVCECIQQVLGFDWLMLFLQDNIHESTVLLATLLLTQLLSHTPSLQRFREANTSTVGGWLQDTSAVLMRNHGLKLGVNSGRYHRNSTSESLGNSTGIISTQLREINLEACRINGFVWLQNLLPYHCGIPELYFLLTALLFGRKVRSLPDNFLLEAGGLYNIFFGGEVAFNVAGDRRSLPVQQMSANSSAPLATGQLCPEAAHVTLLMLTRILCLKREKCSYNDSEGSETSWIDNYPRALMGFYHTLYQKNDEFRTMAHQSDFIGALTLLLLAHPGCKRLASDFVTWGSLAPASLTIRDKLCTSHRQDMDSGPHQTWSQLSNEQDDENGEGNVIDHYDRHPCKQYIWDLLKTIVTESLAFPLSSKQEPIIDVILECASEYGECASLNAKPRGGNSSQNKNKAPDTEMLQSQQHHRWFLTRIAQEIMSHILGMEVFGEVFYIPTGGHSAHIPIQVAYVAARIVDKLWQGHFLGKVKEITSFVNRLMLQTRKRQATLPSLPSGINLNQPISNPNTLSILSTQNAIQAAQETLYRCLNRLALYSLSRPLRSSDDCTSLCNLLTRMCAPQASPSWLHGRTHLFAMANEDMDFIICLLHLLIQLVLGQTNQFMRSNAERSPSKSSIQESEKVPDMKAMKAVQQVANKLWEDLFFCKTQIVEEIFQASGLSFRSYGLVPSTNGSQYPPPPLGSLLSAPLEDYCLHLWNLYMEHEAQPGGCSLHCLRNSPRLAAMASQPNPSETSPSSGASSGTHAVLSYQNNLGNTAKLFRWGRIHTSDGAVGSVLPIPQVGQGAGNVTASTTGATEKITQQLSRLTRMGSGMVLKLASSTSAASNSAASSPSANTSTVNKSKFGGGRKVPNPTDYSTLPYEEARLWIPPHISVVKELNDHNHKQFFMKSTYNQRHVISQWLVWEKELTRERGLWGPSTNRSAVALEKWLLDSSEGPCRMRKKMIPNEHFYQHYPYLPIVNGTLKSSGRVDYGGLSPGQFSTTMKERSANVKYRMPTSHHSRLYYLFYRSRSLLIEEHIQGEILDQAEEVDHDQWTSKEPNLNNEAENKESENLSKIESEIESTLIPTPDSNSLLINVLSVKGTPVECSNEGDMIVVTEDDVKLEMALRQTETLLRARSRSSTVPPHSIISNPSLDETSTPAHNKASSQQFNGIFSGEDEGEVDQEEYAYELVDESTPSSEQYFKSDLMKGNLVNDVNQYSIENQGIGSKNGSGLSVVMEEDSRPGDYTSDINNVTNVPPAKFISEGDNSDVSTKSQPTSPFENRSFSAMPNPSVTSIVAEPRRTASLEALPTERQQIQSHQRMHKLQQQSAVIQLIEPNDKIDVMFRCARVSGLDVYEGILLFGRDHFYFIEGFTIATSGELVDIDSLPPESQEPIVPVVGESSSSSSMTFTKASQERQHFRFVYDDVREIHQRRYILQPIALEVFNVDGRNFLIVFRKPVINKIYAKFAQKCSSALIIPYLASKQKGNKMDASSGLLSSWIGEKSVTQKWERGEINNFTYLMHLNTIAGRSYNDLMQYPVFPWILADYDSEELNLNSPATFRDLGLPMGAQTETRRNQFEMRFREFNDPGSVDEHPPYHYATHYSSAMIVAAYLVRMEPFTQYFLRLQGGYFDLADRMFHSIRDAWLSASKHNMADVKELIPEFFYLPDFLLNANAFDLGQKQSGVVLNDVILPPWAKSDPREFIRAHREALESDYVSTHLHEWIDLIFGYKQRGEAALQAINVFHYLFYEGNVNIYDIEDPVERAAVIGFINNFGQIPTQLFRKPHPQKRLAIPRTPGLPSSASSGSSNPSTDVGIYHSQIRTPNVSGAEKLFFYNVDNMRPAKQPIKELRGAVGQLISVDHWNGLTSGKASSILAVERNRCLLLYINGSGHAFIPGITSGTTSGLSMQTGQSTNASPASTGSSSGAGLSAGSAATSAVVSAMAMGNVVGVSLNSIRSIGWGYDDGSMRLLSGEGGERCVRCMEMLDAPFITHCVTMINERLLVTGGSSTVLRVWELNLNTRSQFISGSVSSLSTTGGPSNMVSGAPVLGSSSTLATEYSFLRHRCNLYGHNDEITCICASASFGIMISGSHDGVCLQWDLGRMTFLRQLYYLSHDYEQASSTCSVGSPGSGVSSYPISALAIHDTTGDMAICAGSWLHLFTLNGQLLASVNTATCSNIIPVGIANQQHPHKRDLIGGNSPNTDTVKSLGPLDSRRINAVAFSQLMDWDVNSVIITGSQDGVVRMWSLDYVRVLCPDQLEVPRQHQNSTSSNYSNTSEEPTSDAGSSRNKNLDVSSIKRRFLLREDESHVRVSEEDNIAKVEGEDEDMEEDEDGEEGTNEKVSLDRTGDTSSIGGLSTSRISALDVDTIAAFDEISLAEQQMSIKNSSPRLHSSQEDLDGDFILIRSPQTSIYDGTLRESRLDRQNIMGEHVDLTGEGLPNKRFIWQRQLVFRSKLTMHTAFERSDNPSPAPITALAVSRDHRVLYVGDEKGRVFCWTVPPEGASKGGPADHWIRDEGSECCATPSCQVKFSLTERRHHCRNCGRVFCSKCSNYECEIYRLRVFKPVRVCGKCYQELRLLNESVNKTNK